MQRSAYGLHNATRFTYVFVLHAVDDFQLSGDRQYDKGLAKTAPTFITHLD
jgi:hypothetical protein